MLSNNPAEKQTPPSSGAADAAAPAPMDPRSPIEVASTGTGTVTDPSGHDAKPPGHHGDHHFPV